MDFLFNLDWSALVKIIILDIVLGGDNAVVIALACSGVPEAYRRKAIFGGTAAAVLLRIIVLGLASYVIQIPFVKLLAGLMLFWIGYQLLTADDDGHNVQPQDRVWAAIKAIAIADLVMSIDNVFAVTGAAQSTGEHSGLYAAGGVLLSIPIIVFGATLISKVIDRFPIITWAGGGLLGWVAAEMVASDLKAAPMLAGVNHTALYVTGAAVVMLAAWLHKTVIALNDTINTTLDEPLL